MFYDNNYTHEQKQLMRKQWDGHEKAIPEEKLTLEEVVTFRKQDQRFHQIVMGVGLPLFLISAGICIYHILNGAPGIGSTRHKTYESAPITSDQYAHTNQKE